MLADHGFAPCSPLCQQPTLLDSTSNVSNFDSSNGMCGRRFSYVCTIRMRAGHTSASPLGVVPTARQNQTHRRVFGGMVDAVALDEPLQLSQHM